MNINIIDPDSIDSEELIRRAQGLHDIGIASGIDNVFQPGFIKELIIAKALGHCVITNKRLPDACNKQNHDIFYEYLSCYENGSCQLDRMFKAPIHKREESLKRITRNAMTYFAIFNKNTITIKSIYEIETPVLLTETERQLDRSGNDISHVGFTEMWAITNGRLVYPIIEDVEVE